MESYNEWRDSIEINETWDLVEFPEGYKLICVKWVYKKKKMNA